jgi:FAD/FMN-containing dehydrogenase
LKPELASLIKGLKPILGDEGILMGAAVSARAAGIWRKDTIAAPVFFRPATTAEVSAVLSACHAVGHSVLTHGGLTGWVEGAIATATDVVLSTEGLNQVEAVDVTDRTMLLQAGVKLQHAQEQAD